MLTVPNGHQYRYPWRMVVHNMQLDDRFPIDCFIACLVNDTGSLAFKLEWHIEKILQSLAHPGLHRRIGVHHHKPTLTCPQELATNRTCTPSTLVNTVDVIVRNRMI